MQLDLLKPEPVYSVSEITRRIKNLLENEFPLVQVDGEVFNLRPQASGHIYFTLKDRQAALKCVMFRMQASRLKIKLANGMQIRCSGRIDLYPPHGQYQLKVERIELSGEGALLLAYARLKRKLEGEGLFEQRHKKSLPFLPRRIGVVTSPTGAAIKDLTKSIFRRFPSRLLVVPARVQGDGAAREIARGIDRLQDVPEIDVIIITRGGGSLQDLWPFNEELVARAVFRSQIPVISAVGHEIDQALSDFVADVRAATPTAAGELVVPSADDLSRRVIDARQRMARALRGSVQTARHRLETTRSRALDPRRLIDQYRWQLDDLLNRLQREMLGRLTASRQRLANLTTALSLLHPGRQLVQSRSSLERVRVELERAMRRILQRHRASVDALQKRVHDLSPVAVLSRGYAIVSDPGSGEIVRRADEAVVGQQVSIRLGLGRLLGTVDQVDPPTKEEK